MELITDALISAGFNVTTFAPPDEQRKSDLNPDQPTTISQQQQSVVADENVGSGQSQQASVVESNVSGDISRIIQRETAEAAKIAAAENPFSIVASATTLSALNELSGASSSSPSSQRLQYDLVQPNELATSQTDPISVKMDNAAAAAPMAMDSPVQQVPPITARPTPERAPIYRSLFKSFKSTSEHSNHPAFGHAHPHKHGSVSRAISGLNGSTGRYQRNLVAVARRRRDRVQPLQPPAQQRMQAAEQRLLQVASAHPSNGDLNMASSSNANPVQQVGPGATGVRSSSTGVGASSNAVSAYLQLLNHRYNLRFPRVSASAAAAAAIAPPSSQVGSAEQ